MSKLKASTIMTPIGNAPPPAYLLGVKPEDLAHGISGEPADFVTPQLILLQAMSLACNRHDPTYIADAEPGDLGETGQLFKGVEGASVLHCGQRNSFPEFLPGRQGFVTVHAELPGDVEARPAENKSRQPVLVRRSSGNVIVPTRELFLLVEGEPAVMYASGSKHFFCRRWMTSIAQYRHPSGKPYPSYSRCWRLSTVQQHNALGHWFGLAFNDLGWAPEDLFKRARDFNRLVEGGGVRLSQPLADVA
jgi:hypothetical protein